MTNSTCSVDGCEKPAKTRGWCPTHYMRWLRHGDVTVGLYASVQDRFWAKVNKSDDCWEWSAFRNSDGYGLFRLDGSMNGAHRVSYQLTHGAIPEGMEVDHACRNRACVNPAHLRLTTRQENMQNRGGAQVNSKSGVLGVYKFQGRWRAKIRHEGKLVSVGTFSTIEEAGEAVKAARMKYYTHNDHDRLVSTTPKK